jgi:hypothetical protein
VAVGSAVGTAVAMTTTNSPPSTLTLVVFGNVGNAPMPPCDMSQAIITAGDSGLFARLAAPPEAMVAGST